MFHLSASEVLGRSRKVFFFQTEQVTKKLKSFEGGYLLGIVTFLFSNTSQSVRKRLTNIANFGFKI